ncbi:MAG TPA: hypothetical protein VGN26_08570, partial [Armatimonadota bacterium]
MRPILASLLLMIATTAGAFAQATSAEPQTPLAPDVRTAAQGNLFLTSELASSAGPLIRVAVANRFALALKDVSAEVVVLDYWGKELARQAWDLGSLEPGKEVERPLSFRPTGTGVYDVRVTAKTGGTSATKMVTVGVVPPPAKGLRPESFFASNTNDKGHNEFDRR